VLRVVLVDELCLARLFVVGVLSVLFRLFLFPVLALLPGRLAGLWLGSIVDG
jgi:hypothetical protein